MSAGAGVQTQATQTLALYIWGKEFFRERES